MPARREPRPGEVGSEPTTATRAQDEERPEADLPRHVEAILDTTGPSSVERGVRLLLALAALVAAFTVGKWTVPTPDESEIERVRVGLCILLDDLGVDSLGPRDLLACPPR